MSLSVMSFMPSGNAAVTRNADSLSFPLAARPQAMSVYVRGRYRGDLVPPLGFTNPRPWAIGDIGTAPCFFLAFSPNASLFIRPRAGISISSAAILAPSAGDIVELLGTLSAAGAVQLTQSLNGGSATVFPLGTNTPLPQTWLTPTIYLGAGGGGSGMDYTHLLILAGVQSLATMQRRAGTFIR